MLQTLSDYFRVPFSYRPLPPQALGLFVSLSNTNGSMAVLSTDWEQSRFISTFNDMIEDLLNNIYVLTLGRCKIISSPVAALTLLVRFYTFAEDI